MSPSEPNIPQELRAVLRTAAARTRELAAQERRRMEERPLRFRAEDAWSRAFYHAEFIARGGTEEEYERYLTGDRSGIPGDREPRFGTDDHVAALTTELLALGDFLHREGFADRLTYLQGDSDEMTVAIAIAHAALAGNAAQVRALLRHALDNWSVLGGGVFHILKVGLLDHIRGVAGLTVQPNAPGGDASPAGTPALVAPPSGSAPGVSESQPDARPTFDRLPASRKKAFGQYQDALRQCRELGPKSTDQEVYDWIREKSDDALPAFTTWARYLREARSALGHPKHSSRAGRETGKSVVRPSEI